MNGVNQQSEGKVEQRSPRSPGGDGNDDDDDDVEHDDDDEDDGEEDLPCKEIMYESNQ